MLEVRGKMALMVQGSRFRVNGSRFKNKAKNKNIIEIYGAAFAVQNLIITH